MKLNDADYFFWVASHLHSISIGIRGVLLQYIDKNGHHKEFYFDYSLNGIEGIERIEDAELLRRVIDKIIEHEAK